MQQPQRRALFCEAERDLVSPDGERLRLEEVHIRRETRACDAERGEETATGDAHGEESGG